MTTKRTGRLIAVSNRLPHLHDPASADEARGQPVGGLVSALRPALEQRRGLWFGWSGKETARARRAPHHLRTGSLRLAAIDLTPAEVEGYYAGFCNRALWPLLHGLPSRIETEASDWRAYLEVNRRFAAALTRILRPGDEVWVHDYHLFPLGRELRKLGFPGPIGFFLHTPFPPGEVFALLPWARELLAGMGAYSLIGFHTRRYLRNFVDAATEEVSAEGDDHEVRIGGRRSRVGVYPIGSDPERFAALAASAETARWIAEVRAVDRDLRILFAADRLDYTKGILARLRALEHLLAAFPAWRRRLRLVQISSPSRTRVAEYLRYKGEVERLVGEINGRYAERDWSPIRYLYRSYSHAELAAFYREADACLVTPLRDGMNLVAKEFVACQEPGDPGVLVLSRFCGAAEELRSAVLVNPYDVEGSAQAYVDALEMPREERVRRWRLQWNRCRENTAGTWRDRFLADLAGRG